LDHDLNRRDFLRAASAGAFVAAASTVMTPAAFAEEAAAKAPETTVKALWDTLTDVQKKEICFAWDYQDPKQGLLRTRVSNNWHITKPVIDTDFFTDKQKGLIREIWEGLYDKEWIAKVEKQLKDDAGGYGKSQNIAIFGIPGTKQFELVMTGRHMTIRCDGNSTEHVAFGGPIFYGHDPKGDFYEGPEHTGNIYWHQAQAANKIYGMLDAKQQAQALIVKSPVEQAAGFRGTDKIPGLGVSEMAKDQQALVQDVLKMLIAPYRQSDKDEVVACLKTQGGLEKCTLSFYRDSDIGLDKVWDNWRLEGPSFVWYFRGEPHVHVWVHIADDSSVKINA
jgi:hypothetical protein